MKVLISGGGTGGHVFPAIAIADALKRQLPSCEFLFVGALGKIEMEKVPAAGYKIIGLDIKGFKRNFSFDTIVTLFKAAKSALKALKIVRSFKPDVAIGVGGYASGPVLKIASVLGVTTMIQEQNSYAGVTNKLLAQKATKIFVAYEGMEKFFQSDKIVLTGNPVRSNIGNSMVSSDVAKLNLGIPNHHKVVLILGGSLGARTLNEAMVAGYDQLRNRLDITIIWQVGKLYLEEFKTSNVALMPNVKPVAFIEDMSSVYAAVDVIVARAGALTISELAIVGKPAILIPSPNVSEDHQTHNAMSLVNAGAALFIEDKKAVDSMVKEMLALLDNEEQLSYLAKNMSAMGKPNAADQIATIIINTIKP